MGSSAGEAAGAGQDPPATPVPGGPIDAPSARKIDRKALDEIFGEVLPETTADERGSGGGETGFSEQWYRENRPPHHED